MADRTNDISEYSNSFYLNVVGRLTVPAIFLANINLIYNFLLPLEPPMFNASLAPKTIKMGI